MDDYLISQAKAIRPKVHGVPVVLLNAIRKLPCALEMKECCTHRGGELVWSEDRALWIPAASCRKCRDAIARMRDQNFCYAEKTFRVQRAIGVTWRALWKAKDINLTQCIPIPGFE